MDNDRNLRFGILALQENLVDAEQFAEACELWSQRKTTGLAELFVERGWISNATRARLEYSLATSRLQNAQSEYLQAAADPNTVEVLDKNTRDEPVPLREIGTNVPSPLAELQRHVDLLQSIVDNMGESLIVVDHHGTLLLVNPAAERLLGARVADAEIDAVLDRYEIYFPDRVTPYPRDALPLFRALRGEIADDERLLIVPSGSEEGRWINANARPLTDSNGAIWGALLVLREVTAGKEVGEEPHRSRG